MSPDVSGALFLAPLALYTLHAMWRLIASDSLPALLAFVAAYFIAAILFRLNLPTLPLVPVWLPLLYPYVWTGIASLLLACSSLRLGRGGLRLDGIPPLLSAYVLSQLCLHAGLLTFSTQLAGRPLQAYAMLPPLVAACGYLLYRLCLWVCQQRQGWLPWVGVLFCAALAPMALAWAAELLVPLLLRHF